MKVENGLTKIVEKNTDNFTSRISYNNNNNYYYFVYKRKLHDLPRWSNSSALHSAGQQSDRFRKRLSDPAGNSSRRRLYPSCREFSIFQKSEMNKKQKRRNFSGLDMFRRPLFYCYCCVYKKHSYTHTFFPICIYIYLFIYLSYTIIWHDVCVYITFYVHTS